MARKQGRERGDSPARAIARAAADGASVAPPARRRPNAFASLKNRDFRFLTLSTLAIGFGQWGQQVALGWLVFVLTDSVSQLAQIAFLGGILSLVLGPAGGIISDRYPRRNLIVVVTLADTLQAAAIAVLVLTGLVQVWHVYVFAMLSALTMSMNQPALQAYVADIMEPETLPNAIAMNSIAQNMSRIAGPSLAGALTVASVGAPFLFVAAMRGLACVNTMMMRAQPAIERAGRRHPFREVIDGFDYVLREPQLRVLLLINALPALLVYPYISFMPIFADRVLHEGAAAYGLLVSILGVGSVVGLIALALLGDVPRRGMLMLGAFIAYAALVVAFAQSRELWQALAALTTAGVFHGFALAMNNTLFQTVIRPEMRGRGMAAWQMCFGLVPIGALAMGAAINQAGIRSSYGAFFGACFAGFVLIAVLNRAIRRA